jgi:hypothetical protein
MHVFYGLAKDSDLGHSHASDAYCRARWSPVVCQRRCLGTPLCSAHLHGRRRLAGPHLGPLEPPEGSGGPHPRLLCRDDDQLLLVEPDDTRLGHHRVRFKDADAAGVMLRTTLSTRTLATCCASTWAWGGGLVPVAGETLSYCVRVPGGPGLRSVDGVDRTCNSHCQPEPPSLAARNSRHPVGQ